MVKGKKFLKKFACILALVASSGTFGGHWTIPRLAIWTLMIVDYSRTTSLGRAIEETLSGEKPCGRCHQLSLAQQAEKRQAPVSLDSMKTVVFVISKGNVLPAREEQPLQTLGMQTSNWISQFAFEPPTPPPRNLLVA